MKIFEELGQSSATLDISFEKVVDILKKVKGNGGLAKELLTQMVHNSDDEMETGRTSKPEQIWSERPLPESPVHTVSQMVNLHGVIRGPKIHYQGDLTAWELIHDSMSSDPRRKASSIWCVND